MRNLTEIRTRITAIDEQISALFRERMQVSVDVAEYKRTAGTSIYDPVREHANIAAASERVPEELASYAAALQIVLMEASRAVQHRHLDLHVPLSQLTQPVGSAADHDGCTEDVHLSFAATVPPAPQSSCIIATCCFVLGINLVKLEQQRGGEATPSCATSLPSSGLMTNGCRCSSIR